MVLRDLAQFHENPAVIAWWQNAWGRALVWFSVPQRRRRTLAAASLGIALAAILHAPARFKGLPLPQGAFGVSLVFAAQALLLYLWYQAAVHFARLPAWMRRHPQMTLHASYGLLLLLLGATVGQTGLVRGVLLALAILYPVLIWRIGYMLMAGQQRRMGGTGVADHLFYLWPAYGGSDTPYGKGLSYLSQHEASTPDELARSQLAGIKLLLLAVLWRIVLTVFEGTLYGSGNWFTRAIGGHTAGIAQMEDLLPRGAGAPLLQAWFSVYGELFEHVLRLSIKGHLIVGMLRLFGFNVFRNTYKPLLAESIAEFWNRYFYYFKELLVTFFFMPTFTGFGKRLRQWPRLRLMAAVFAAAFVGNVYYHVIKDAGLVQADLAHLLFIHENRSFYCLLLAIGIYVSMLREQNRRGSPLPGGRARRVMRIFGVWTFFGLIFIWNAGGSATFGHRLDFFLGLFTRVAAWHS